jgi:hypothetical protein
MSFFETSACTAAESVNPRMSGQRISQNIAKLRPRARTMASTAVG